MKGRVSDCSVFSSLFPFLDFLSSVFFFSLFILFVVFFPFVVLKDLDKGWGNGFHYFSLLYFLCYFLFSSFSFSLLFSFLCYFRSSCCWRILDKLFNSTIFLCYVRLFGVTEEVEYGKRYWIPLFLFIVSSISCRRWMGLDIRRGTGFYCYFFVIFVPLGLLKGLDIIKDIGFSCLSFFSFLWCYWRVWIKEKVLDSLVCLYFLPFGVTGEVGYRKRYWILLFFFVIIISLVLWKG